MTSISTGLTAPRGPRLQPVIPRSQQSREAQEKAPGGVHRTGCWKEKQQREETVWGGWAGPVPPSRAGAHSLPSPGGRPAVMRRDARRREAGQQQPHAGRGSAALRGPPGKE